MREFDPDQIKNIELLRKNGASLLDLCNLARKIGLNAAALEIDLVMLRKIYLPVILHWNLNHFVVLFKISRYIYHIADPALGIIKVPKSELLEGWQTKSSGSTKKRVALLFSEEKYFYIK